MDNSKLVLNPNDKCYTYSLGIISIKMAFDMLIPEDEYEELDRDFDWIITSNYVIIPLGFTRFKAGSAGTGEDTTSSYIFEYDILWKTDINIFNEIKNYIDYINNNKLSKKLLKELNSYIFDTIINKDIEILLDFKNNYF